MEKISLHTPGFSSEIVVGVDWGFAESLIPDTGVIIVTDDNVRDIYGERFPDYPVLSVRPGEESKKLEVVEHLANELLAKGMDRSGFILAIGGGVVCDLAGFLASIYMRGVRCGYISTTLLSQVDASTGGKNGVNLGETKNILGNIRQPEFVICDPAMLKTLSEQEYLSGLAELIKTAIIGDRQLFDTIEECFKEIMARDYDLLTRLITRSVKFKAEVVTEDEKESGLRRILNFGHTYGHAVELHEYVKHGFAVASGMEFATEFSYSLQLISKIEKERIISLLKRFGLLINNDIPASQIETLMLHDKKKAGDDIHFVFTEGIGKATVRRVSIVEIMDFYRLFRNIN